MSRRPAKKILARLIGQFCIEGVDGLPVRSRKALALLAYLACSDGFKATRPKLAGLLWSDRGEEQARNSLRQTIGELRRAIPDADGRLIIDRDAIAFAEDVLERDVDLVMSLARQADAAALTALLRPLPEGLLAGLEGSSPAYDEWLASERTALEDRVVSAILDAVPAMIGKVAAHDLGAVLSALERLDPLDERITRMRMRASHGEGDTAALHRSFRRLADDLGRELGVGPSSETRTLFDTLLTTEEPASVAIDVAQASVGAAASPDRADSGLTPPVILVTPIATVGDGFGPDVASICTEDIRIGLAQNRELRVLMVDPGDEERARTIMGNAIASYRLSGSARAAGDHVVVNTQLGDMSTGLICWSEQMRFAGEPLALIDMIVERVVGAVPPAIDRELAKLAVHSAGPDEAAILYARGRQMVRSARTLADAERGAAMLEEVLTRDPRHVGACLQLSQLYNTDFFFLVAGHDVAAYRARALQLIEDADMLDPGNVRISLRLAWCRLRRAEWLPAERLFRAAVTAMPHDADALDECAFGLTCLGVLDVARELMQRAFRLNPFAPAEYHADHAVLLALSGEADEAEQHFSVCGERRLPYRAVRLGNLLRSDLNGEKIGALCDDFASGFGVIWRGAAPPSRADAAAWVDSSLCLRLPHHRELVLAGVEAALFGIREGALCRSG